MDARTNFLTAPAPAQRGNDVLAEPSGGEASASGAQFAGVLNGQMLKLERQALASPAAESADLQVLRLGNKLNVITTDAPLPDLASLADFARAQGLGESAVQALFGSVGSGLASISAPISVSTGMPAQATELPDSGNPQAAQALAQTAAASLIQLALTSTPTGAVAGENWLGQRSPIAGTTDAAEAFKASASVVVVGGTSEVAVAPALAMDTLNPWSALHALRNRGLTSEAAPAVVDRATPLEVRSTQLAPAALSPEALAAAALSPEALAAAALAAAVQAGLGMAVVQQATELDESAVTLTSLSIEKPGSSPAASLIEAKAAVLVGAKVISQTTAPLMAVAAEEEVPDQPQADLQIRLLPPDQAITQRLAQMAGKSKSIDWSALLAGQKVSDTLAGLAQSPMPALSDTQAKLVTQMQANGQLPDSGDEARNALLAKLQVQAASAGVAPAGLSAQAGTPALESAAQPQLAAGIAPLASQSAGAATVLPTKDTAPSAPSALAAQGAGAAQALHQARPQSLWESVRIEVPSGLILEALQEQQAQKSDAEPTVPLSAAAGATSNLAHSLASDKAQVTTPQALAEQRAAQYQEVADQLGEAMAKRLMAQIERGQWKMQLRMQPAALGRIDVELDMHARGLDATFTSDNAVTRELMAQGSARLRDTLTQTGTTVASVVVNGDSGRQSGGNSTPGRKSKGEQGEKSNKSDTAAPVIAAARSASGQGNGLNVLA